MPLLDDLRQLAEQVKKRMVNVRGEEATKQALVLPFLQTLGYDVYDPTVVQPEYVSDFAKKRAAGQAEKVDFALHAGGQPVIFIEAKPADAPLVNHDPQLARYFNATPAVKLAIITDGVKYRFFTDLTQPNVMDADPFFEFNLLKFSERDVENLSCYTCGAYSPDAVQGHAQELFFVEKVANIIGELLRNPSENFVRFLLDEVQLVQGRVTARVVERFVPIVKKSIHSTLVDMMTKSISQEVLDDPLSPAPPPVAPRPYLSPLAVTSAMGVAKAVSDPTPSPGPVSVARPETDEGPKVETTAEELAIFQFVREACDASPTKATIAYKDTITYFSITLGKVTRWFLRFFCNGPRKFVTSRLTVEQVKALVPGAEVDPVSDPFARSRVYFRSLEDLAPMRALFVAAFEQETKRKEADTVEVN
jgi:predicted type IV restriction endonuclease